MKIRKELVLTIEEAEEIAELFETFNNEVTDSNLRGELYRAKEIADKLRRVANYS